MWAFNSINFIIMIHGQEIIIVIFTIRSSISFQRCTNPGQLNFLCWHLIFVSTSVWNLFYATQLAPTVLRWLLDLYVCMYVCM